MQFDHGNAGMRAAGTVAPPADLDDGFSTLSVNRFKTRVLDRQLRDATDASTAMCSRDAAIPRGGAHVSTADEDHSQNAAAPVHESWSPCPTVPSAHSGRR